MSKMNTLSDLLVEELKDIYSAENQLVKALPKMAKAASNPTLKSAFETHAEETKVQAQRIEQAMEQLGASPRGKTCKAMQGLLEEGAEIMKEEGNSVVKDAALIGAAQKVEHYEISAYGTARAIAEILGHDEIAELLATTLEEESDTDEKLNVVAEDINAEAFELQGSQA